MMVNHGDWVQQRVVVRKHFTSRVSISDHDALHVLKGDTNDESVSILPIIALNHRRLLSI